MGLPPFCREENAYRLMFNKRKRCWIAIEGGLSLVVERIMSKSRDEKNPALLQDSNGRRLTYFALRSRFDRAREAAGVNFQFRDLRAKAATDVEDLAHAQTLLGHKNRSTTEIYTRERRGDFVRPLSRENEKLNDPR